MGQNEVLKALYDAESRSLDADQLGNLLGIRSGSARRSVGSLSRFGLVITTYEKQGYMVTRAVYTLTEKGCEIYEQQMVNSNAKEKKK